MIIGSPNIWVRKPFPHNAFYEKNEADQWKIATDCKASHKQFFSYSERQGRWYNEKSCKSGYLSSFTLRLTPPQGLIDDASAENLKFKCSDGTELEGSGQKWGEYGSWSQSCKEGGICGIETKVASLGWLHEEGHTELNDVKFFCCI